MPAIAAVGVAIAAVSEVAATAAAAIGTFAVGLGVPGVITATGVTGLAGAIGTGVVGAVIGAGVGAVTTAIGGGDVGKGALFGGITGGITAGVGPSLGTAIGSSTAGETIAGTAAGAIGAEATGQNPLVGAVEGGAGGFISGATSSTGAADATGATTTAMPGGAAPGSSITPSSGGIVTPTGATDITAAQIGAQVAPTTGTPGVAAPPTTDVGSLIGAQPLSAAAQDVGAGTISSAGTIGPGGNTIPSAEALTAAPAIGATPAPSTSTPSTNLSGATTSAAPSTTPNLSSPALASIGATPTSTAGAGFLGASDVPGGPLATSGDFASPGVLPGVNDLLNAPSTGGGGGAPTFSPTAGVSQSDVSAFMRTGATPSTNVSGGESASTWDQINKILASPVTKLGVGLAPAALTLINGQPAVPSAINPLTTSGEVTGPLIAAEQTNLNAANAGQLTPGAAASIIQFQQQAEQALYQQLANEGVRDPRQDSRFIAGMQQIQSQVAQLTQQFITQQFTLGFQAAGEARGALVSAANAQIANDNAFQTALRDSMLAFGASQGIRNIAA